MGRKRLHSIVEEEKENQIDLSRIVSKKKTKLNGGRSKIVKSPVIFTPLRNSNLLATPNHGAHSVLKKYGLKVLDNQTPKHGKYASVYAATVTSPAIKNLNEMASPVLDTPKRPLLFQSPNVMIKVQMNSKYKDKDNICIREMNINKVLTSNLGNRCPNFIHMYAASNIKSGIDEEESDTNPHFIYVMEKADMTLREYMKKKEKESGVTCNFIKSCLFQLFFFLALAQESCEFQHNDLHFNNVLLKKLKDNVQAISFHIGNRIYMTNERYLIKLADFGLSRIKLSNGQIICNKNSRCDFFAESEDIKQIYRELRTRKMNWNNIADEGERQKQRSLFRDLKQMMGKEIYGPKDLLNHAFFDSFVVSEDDPNLNSDQVLHFGDFQSSNERENLRKSLSEQINNAAVLSSRHSKNGLPPQITYSKKASVSLADRKSVV